MISPVLFFFLKIALAIQDFFYFHSNCEITCSSSVKNAVGSLIGIALNLWIALGGILMFTILILPIQEHGIIRDYYQQLYANKMDNLEEMDKFLEKYNFPKLNKEEIKILTEPSQAQKLKE